MRPDINDTTADPDIESSAPHSSTPADIGAVETVAAIDRASEPTTDIPLPPPWRSPARRWQVAVGTLLVGLAVSTSWLGVICRNDRAQADARAGVALAAADAATAVLTYHPDTVTDDLARARTHLSGDFATYFGKLGTDVVVPAARQRQMSSTATVTATSVVSADTAHAVALVFVNQVTTATDQQQPTATSSSLRLQLDWIDGRWLVTKLDTV
ncbi:hypothetical protein [Nocardia sp. NPDC052112]|uniref:hypothetical protein n=1 Tax=Nocardia sp. NPDC052112 TaxID=3155646 RepID=UPI00342D1A3A